jgi:hypothetical protein
VRLAAGLGVLPYALYLLYWPLGVGASVVATAFAFRHKVRTGVLLLGLSPLPLIPALAFLGGATTYVAGSAVLKTYGMPDPEFGNLDPQGRCRRRTSGCVVDGSEVFTQGPNNVAVRLMIRLFGPMSGAYTGPYPTRHEAFDALRLADPGVKLSDEDRKAIKGLSSTLGDDPELRVADYKGETRVIGTSTAAVLMSVHTGEVYARYVCW